MFDISFGELVLVFIVGLVVLGPQRLPVAIRTVMGWVRTIRGLAANVQNELSQELKLQELQESIKKAEALNLSQLSPELNETVEELKKSAQKMQADLDSATNEIKGLTEKEVAEIQGKIEQESQRLQAEAKEAGDEQIAEGDKPLSHAELAELAEMDESKFSVYYPPDDKLASVKEPEAKQDKKDVS
ncbi:twin arginine-targeting protein translocase TatB [Pasteurellaceae bacterium 15-036681]|nr:twin arginine-targeting protein translocase TatB [Pasteurellaceae bacterium 15-036681]